MSKDHKECDKCGRTTTKKARFRTGDKQRPGYDIEQCPGCGDQCNCPVSQPEETEED